MNFKNQIHEFLNYFLNQFHEFFKNIISRIFFTAPNAEDEQQRTRLPSFSSIIAGSPKAPELQDLCLVDQPEPPQVPVEDHHSLPSSRRGSVDHDSRPNLDIRR